MSFLHGVEVLDVDDGSRPIQVVRSSVIGIVGTAPDSVEEVKSTLLTGVVASNNAITWTSKLAGILGDKISVRLRDPGAASQALSVNVNGLQITVNLATSAGSAITSTATLVLAAIAADEEANALVGVASTGASSGAGLVAALVKTLLSGGVTEAFPLNTPVMVAGNQQKAALLGRRGTLPDQLDSIFDQTGAAVIVVRVAKDEDEGDQLANVVGGVNSGDGSYEGVHVFLGAKSVLGFQPRILIAPGFTHQRPDDEANPVVAELIGIADRLRAVIIADGPNTTDEDAITYRGDFGSKRVFLHDPWDRKLDTDTGEAKDVPASGRIAGQIAKSDNERGFWWSPSNQTVNGIVGTSRAVDFQLGDSNCRANLLNEQAVATTIRENGYRLWGNRTLSDDPKYAFLSVVRTADIINDSILAAHLWAVDRNITKTYVKDVTEGVNDFLRTLKTLGAVLGGTCWADPDLNSPSEIAQGHVYFDFDFTPPYPAERLTFRSHLVDKYLTEIF